MRAGRNIALFMERPKRTQLFILSGQEEVMLQPQHAIRAIEAGPMFSRKSVSIGVVAGLHILVIWALLAAIVPHVMKDFDHTIDVIQIKQPKPPGPLPPPRPPVVTPPTTVPLQPPDVSNIPDDPDATPINPTPPAPTPVVRSSTIPDRGPVAPVIGEKPPYPALAARMHREGAVTVRLSVSETGKVTAAQLVKSSGYAELDQAALQWVVGWKYKPALKDGQAVASTTEDTVIFNLEDR